MEDQQPTQLRTVHETPTQKPQTPSITSVTMAMPGAYPISRSNSVATYRTLDSREETPESQPAERVEAPPSTERDLNSSFGSDATEQSRSTLEGPNLNYPVPNMAREHYVVTATSESRSFTSEDSSSEGSSDSAEPLRPGLEHANDSSTVLNVARDHYLGVEGSEPESAVPLGSNSSDSVLVAPLQRRRTFDNFHSIFSSSFSSSLTERGEARADDGQTIEAPTPAQAAEQGQILPRPTVVTNRKLCTVTQVHSASRDGQTIEAPSDTPAQAAEQGQLLPDPTVGTRRKRWTITYIRNTNSYIHATTPMARDPELPERPDTPDPTATSLYLPPTSNSLTRLRKPLWGSPLRRSSTDPLQLSSSASSFATPSPPDTPVTPPVLAADQPWVPASQILAGRPYTELSGPLQQPQLDASDILLPPAVSSPVLPAEEPQQPILQPSAQQPIAELSGLLRQPSTTTPLSESGLAAPSPVFDLRVTPPTRPPSLMTFEDALCTGPESPDVSTPLTIHTALGSHPPDGSRSPAACGEEVASELPTSLVPGLSARQSAQIKRRPVGAGPSAYGGTGIGAGIRSSSPTRSNTDHRWIGGVQQLQASGHSQDAGSGGIWKWSHGEPEGRRVDWNEWYSRRYGVEPGAHPAVDETTSAVSAGDMPRQTRVQFVEPLPTRKTARIEAYAQGSAQDEVGGSKHSKLKKCMVRGKGGEVLRQRGIIPGAGCECLRCRRERKEEGCLVM